MIVSAKKHKGTAAAVLAGAALLGGSISYGITNAHSDAAAAKKQATERAAVIRESQVGACQSSLEPGGVRFIVAQQIQASVTAAKQVDYHQLFPNIDRKQLHDLIRDDHDRQVQEIHDLLNVNCDALYPRIPK